MSIHNEEVDNLIKDKLVEFQTHLNTIETELSKTESEFSRSVIAIAYGKITKLYEDITYFIGVFDGVPKNVGR